MEKRILGLHHVTAIADDPQRNLEFYTDILGLRLVKVTVNYDDPQTYHLYFGDEAGRPGSILTFFPWPGARKGRRGVRQATAVSFAIPEDAISYWLDRLEDRQVLYNEPERRFDEDVITLFDPDGLQLELVTAPGPAVGSPWTRTVSERYAIRGFHSVTLTEEGYERTASLLSQTLCFKLIAESGNRFRFALRQGGAEKIVDILCAPTAPVGEVAVGTVHHVAFRTPNEEEQRSWRQDLFGVGLNVTPVINRNYFRSIYFREPGGVLFEIATDTPGFAIDEPMEELGSRLALPPWLEPSRAQLERTLPALKLPQLIRA